MKGNNSLSDEVKWGGQDNGQSVEQGSAGSRGYLMYGRPAYCGLLVATLCRDHRLRHCFVRAVRLQQLAGVLVTQAQCLKLLSVKIQCTYLGGAARVVSTGGLAMVTGKVKVVKVEERRALKNEEGRHQGRGASL